MTNIPGQRAPGPHAADGEHQNAGTEEDTMHRPKTTLFGTRGSILALPFVCPDPRQVIYTRCTSISSSVKWESKQK